MKVSSFKNISVCLLIAIFSIFMLCGCSDNSSDSVVTSETLLSDEHKEVVENLDQSKEIASNFDAEPYVIVLYDDTKEISYQLYQGYNEAMIDDQTIKPFTNFISFNSEKGKSLAEKFDVEEPSIIFSNGEVLGTTPIKGYNTEGFKNIFRNLNFNTFRNF